MNFTARVASPPAKPLVVFDGDCGFCTLWIKRWQQATDKRVDYLPYQDAEIARRFPEISREQFQASVQLIATDDRVFGGAQAVLRALASNPSRQWLLRAYERSAFLAATAERAYRFVAGHRSLFSALTRLAYGQHVERPSHLLTRWVFLRGLGMIYLIAFVSLWVQIAGLIGSNGVLPAEKFMDAVHQQADAHGLGADRYRLLPTLCWWSASDGALNSLCGAGTVLSMLLIAGVAPVPALALLWLCYLSLSVVGQTFLSFQWDTLLLETGFLAIFFAPRRWLPGLSREAPPSRISLWLLRWLLFRLMIQSGVTKLLYHDPTWLHCTALTFHYETQPLPTWLGWYAHQLPLAAQKFSCVAMFVIEVGLPFLFFAPRRIRFVAAGATVFLQALIGLTGNYNFFNLLTVLLCVPLLDDFALQKFIPRAARRFFTTHHALLTIHTAVWRSWLVGLFAALVVLVTTVEMLSNCRVNFPWPNPVAQLTELVAPLRTFNSYGLFRVMTRPRYEIIIEGSEDGVAWLAYEFKYKPGDVQRRPGFVEPHQPRLDWQMWFAALGDFRDNPWFANLCVRLLQGSPEVLALLERNPFPAKPPRHVRARLYEYHFASPAERRETGTWWRREFKRDYLPAISLTEEQTN